MVPARTGRNLSPRKPLSVKDNVRSDSGRPRRKVHPIGQYRRPRKPTIGPANGAGRGTESRPGLLPEQQNR